MHVGNQRKLSSLTAVVLLIVGCESRDERLAEFAGHALHQQARQNEEMARQSQQVAQQSEELAKSAHSLVEQDAAARRELIAAQSEAQARLHDERTSVDIQRRELQDDQRASAARDPIIGQAILVTGYILAALLPLLVTAYALRRLPDPSPNDELLSESVIEILAAEAIRVPSGDVPALDNDTDAPRLVGAGPPEVT